MGNIHLFKKRSTKLTSEMHCGEIIESLDVDQYETIDFSNVTCPGCIASDQYKILKKLDIDCNLIKKNCEEN